MQITYMNMHNARWTSLAVADVLHSSGRTIRSVAEETEIPYSTLRRKLASESAFTLSELYLLAGCLGVTPSRFLRPDSRAPVDAGGRERLGGSSRPCGHPGERPQPATRANLPHTSTACCGHPVTGDRGNPAAQA